MYRGTKDHTALELCPQRHKQTFIYLLTLKVTVQPSGKPAALASAMAASIFSSSVFWGFDGLDLGGIFAESTGRYHVSPKIVEGQTKA